MKRLILFGALCLPAFLAGCIHNDLPYPVVTINIEAIEAEGLDGAAQINAAQQTVILPLLETTDIRNVHITSVTLTEGGQSSVAFPGTFDLRTPLYTTLSLYQEYGWSIAATQTIERYFRVKKQVGAAEIELDRETGETQVVNFVAAVDCGTPINPNLARVQTEGGILQGIGMALTENITYDRRGMPAENSLMQYKIPTRQDIGRISVEFEASYEETGPYGAKSIGEVVINTPLPAIADAVYNATGKRFRELPITPEQIAMAAK